MKVELIESTIAKVGSLLGRPPYKTGVALSGGGARGFAHVGVLEAMSEVGIKPTIVAGVSAGAVAASFYAAGIPFDEMIKAFVDSTFSDFSELSVPREGFFKLDRFCKFLQRNIPYKRIEDLPIKTVICATNIDTGEPVAFEEGPLAECVIASCSIPIVFKPRIIAGKRYVDGGVLHNLPAWAIRERCRTLYGINVSPMPAKIKKPKSMIDMAVTSFKLMAKNNAVADMELCDKVIQVTDIAEYNVFNLKEIRKIYRLGYLSAKTVLTQ